MKAQELRIGNYVEFSTPALSINIKELSHKVSSKDLVNLEENKILLEPIPLTEEWLVKLGFDSTPHHENVVYYYNVNFDFRIEAYSNGYISFEEWADLKYVHQLQNLYFALTEQELTIKP